MNYRDENGKVVSDEQLDKMLEDVEKGDFSNFEPASELVYGMIEPKKVERSAVCVQFPVPMKERLTQIANSHSCSLSELIRAYTYDGIQREEREAKVV